MLSFQYVDVMPMQRPCLGRAQGSLELSFVVSSVPVFSSSIAMVEVGSMELSFTRLLGDSSLVCFI